MKCNFRFDDSQRTTCKAETQHGARKCYKHRNNLPQWAQEAVDTFFGADATIHEWSPGDDCTRYTIRNATGSHIYTESSYLGRGAFLGALKMLHYAIVAQHRVKALGEQRSA